MKNFHSEVNKNMVSVEKNSTGYNQSFVLRLRITVNKFEIYYLGKLLYP